MPRTASYPPPFPFLSHPSTPLPSDSCPLLSFSPSPSLLVCFRSYLYISILSFLLISGLPVNNKRLLPSDKHKPYSAKSLEPLGCATQLKPPHPTQHNHQHIPSHCWIFHLPGLLDRLDRLHSFHGFLKPYHPVRFGVFCLSRQLPNSIGYIPQDILRYYIPPLPLHWIRPSCSFAFPKEN